MLRTPLNALHRLLGARMVDFAGWDMPVQYPAGILAEHQAVRTACGLFDLSHMGRVFLRGPDALALAQECCTRDLARIRAGEAAYSAVCRPDGGILDDVIAYVLGHGEVLVVFNASNREPDIDWFGKQRDRLGLVVDLDDRTTETGLIGVQGPSAQAALQAVCTADLEPLPGYAFVDADIAGRRGLVSRTGYTGEDGFELMCEADAAETIWEALLGRGAVACGLGARDTLRTEAGFALYGHDIDTTTDPFAARLGWVVSLRKASFVGREALAQIKTAGPTRRLVGLRVAPGGVPRPGFPILAEGQQIGAVTSGTYSPTLKQNIAMGYVPVALAEIGQSLAVEMRGKPAGAEVVPLPFVPHRSRPRVKM
ncbi:MAG TPA: glycine cleavage system aminomethyltransferase GcvT [Chloroflexota bacterium]|nr:glycine cleavage system aminomethyltransferase GcvT [Chloroflexota bacterium]